ncbi:MAG: DUF4344 domain-containing metallopeptidase, partial [Pseudomonadota bacterium]
MPRWLLAASLSFGGITLAAPGLASGADDKEWSAPESFVASNVIGTFYHELAHAVIDVQSVAVLGQEEDAADVFSILLIDA